MLNLNIANRSTMTFKLSKPTTLIATSVAVFLTNSAVEVSGSAYRVDTSDDRRRKSILNAKPIRTSLGSQAVTSPHSRTTSRSGTPIASRASSPISGRGTPSSTVSDGQHNRESVFAWPTSVTNNSPINNKTRRVSTGNSIARSTSQTIRTVRSAPNLLNQKVTSMTTVKNSVKLNNPLSSPTTPKTPTSPVRSPKSPANMSGKMIMGTSRSAPAISSLGNRKSLTSSSESSLETVKSQPNSPVRGPVNSVNATTVTTNNTLGLKSLRKPLGHTRSHLLNRSKSTMSSVTMTGKSMARNRLLYNSMSLPCTSKLIPLPESPQNLIDGTVDGEFLFKEEDVSPIHSIADHINGDNTNLNGADVNDESQLLNTSFHLLPLDIVDKENVSLEDDSLIYTDRTQEDDSFTLSHETSPQHINYTTVTKSTNKLLENLPPFHVNDNHHDLDASFDSFQISPRTSSSLPCSPSTQMSSSPRSPLNDRNSKVPSIVPALALGPNGSGKKSVQFATEDEIIAITARQQSTLNSGRNHYYNYGQTSNCYSGNYYDATSKSATTSIPTLIKAKKTLEILKKNTETNNGSISPYVFTILKLDNSDVNGNGSLSDSEQFSFDAIFQDVANFRETKMKTNCGTEVDDESLCYSAYIDVGVELRDTINKRLVKEKRDFDANYGNLKRVSNINDQIRVYIEKILDKIPVLAIDQNSTYGKDDEIILNLQSIISNKFDEIIDFINNMVAAVNLNQDFQESRTLNRVWFTDDNLLDYDTKSQALSEACDFANTLMKNVYMQQVNVNHIINNDIMRKSMQLSKTSTRLNYNKEPNTRLNRQSSEPDSNSEDYFQPLLDFEKYLRNSRASSMSPQSKSSSTTSSFAPGSRQARRAAQERAMALQKSASEGSFSSSVLNGKTDADYYWQGKSSGSSSGRRRSM